MEGILFVASQMGCNEMQGQPWLFIARDSFCCPTYCKVYAVTDQLFAG